jgi:hypothetical protein
MNRKITIATILLACVLTQFARTQSTYGDLLGVTSDPSGLPLPHATASVPQPFRPRGRSGLECR